MTLLTAFLSDTLDASDFSHRAHVEVGFEILRRHPIQDATQIYVTHLKALVKRAGAEDKFSLRTTENAMALIATRMVGGARDIDGFFAAHPDLLHSATFKTA